MAKRYILTFTTPGGNYVYDREINSLLSVSDEEFASFQRIEAGEDGDEDWALLDRYVEQGYLQETRLKEIKHPATPYMEFLLESCIEQINLQVTQNCNLRCRYCAYAGNYENQRVHSNKSMSLETLKKSVDFFMERSIDLKRKAIIGFYGGEPLLEFNKIKACLDYIKQSYNERFVRYTITTNGTLFSNDMINFLDENQFEINISLDGPKDLHNENRIFPSGEGSFDEIMDNLEYIRANFPDFFKRISFFTTVAPKVDLSCVNNFFNASDIMKDQVVSQNILSAFNSKEKVSYDDLYHVTYIYQQTKVLLSSIGLYGNSKISKLFTTSLESVKRLYSNLSRGGISEISHPSGPCLAGVMRPFVDTDGNIFPCERVSENSSIMRIGHISEGINLTKSKNMINIGNLTKENCSECWNFLHCNLCIASCDADENFSKEKRIESCFLALSSTLTNLKTICLLLENGYDFEEF